ncbi:MAG: hypothetical protein AB7F09_01915 [Parvibaculaceae bacterium]
MSTSHPQFLRYVLIADAVASGATGALMILGSSLLAGMLALPGGLLFEAGLILVPYVLLVAIVASRPIVPVKAVWFIIACNALWTVGSLAVLVSGLVAPNALGYAFVIAQAAAVALLGELQYMALRRKSVAA